MSEKDHLHALAEHRRAFSRALDECRVCQGWRVWRHEWWVVCRASQTGVLRASPCLEAGTGARDWPVEQPRGPRELEPGPGLRARRFYLWLRDGHGVQFQEGRSDPFQEGWGVWCQEGRSDPFRVSRGGLRQEGGSVQFREGRGGPNRVLQVVQGAQARQALPQDVFQGAHRQDAQGARQFQVPGRELQEHGAFFRPDPERGTGPSPGRGWQGWRRRVG